MHSLLYLHVSHSCSYHHTNQIKTKLSWTALSCVYDLFFLSNKPLIWVTLLLFFVLSYPAFPFLSSRMLSCWFLRSPPLLTAECGSCSLSLVALKASTVSGGRRWKEGTFMLKSLPELCPRAAKTGRFRHVFQEFDKCQRKNRPLYYLNLYIMKKSVNVKITQFIKDYNHIEPNRPNK